MSSKKQTRKLHGNRTEPDADISRYYREIGIKAVAAAARKESSTLVSSVDERVDETNVTKEDADE